MATMLGVASGRVVRLFEIQVAKATNGQKNDSAEESIIKCKHLKSSKQLNALELFSLITSEIFQQIH